MGYVIIIEHMFAEESTAQQNSESSRTPDWFNALRSEPTYENSFLVEQLAAQATKSSGWNKLYTGFVDLDGTFSYTYKPTDAEKQLLNPEALKKLILEKSQPYIQASDRLTSKLQQRNISLIAVTGRDLSLIQRGQAGGSEYETAHFPQFVVCAGAVGTELYILQHDGSYLLDEQWENYIKNHFGFDRDLLYGGCVSVVERFRQHAPDMKLQFQSRDSLENVQA
ncbi:hypothetical protein HY358_01870 [Candidatus Roizmanbacteria bacterium]|nr:hypothetical protein [Candidatus Roizmanbacteria bacterium]